MLLLDTNVLSEFMRPQPADVVVAWLDAQPAAQLYICAVSRAEIELGLALMPVGKRQAALVQAAQGMFEDDFSGQCLPFDEAAASAYACIVAARTRAGRSCSRIISVRAMTTARSMALRSSRTLPGQR